MSSTPTTGRMSWSKRLSVACLLVLALLIGVSLTVPAVRQSPPRGRMQFGASPLKLEEIELIQPMGQMIGGHVTPIDHGYIFGVGSPNVPADRFEIRAPAQGWIVELSRTERSFDPPFVDHAIDIEFTSTLSVHYSNLSSFDRHIVDKAGAIPVNGRKRVRIPVKEGQIVGRTGRTGIDFSVRDTELVLPGFLVPEHYTAEAWKIHSADLFEHFREPLRSQLMAKGLRQAAPRGGKIDYDIDGRLVGNWFVAGTNGYAGITPGREGYWKTHLAIAYDALDPAGIVFSIGDWQGEARQFGVQGNAPDPKDVSVATGLVKYELLEPDWVVTQTGKRWDRWRYAKGLTFQPHTEGVKGVILLQMIAPRKLKVATFPGKTALDVNEFGNASTLYER